MIESFKLPNITPETLTGSIVSFTDEYGGLPLKSCTSLISGYQEGSGTPSPSNVRPLHAWSGANLTACGVNLFGGETMADYIVANVQNATKDTTNKTVTYTAQRIDGVELFNKFKADTRYTIFCYVRSGTYSNIKIDYSDNTSSNIPVNSLFVSDDNKTVVRMRGVWSTGSTELYYDDFGIFEGILTDNDFKSYNGNTYTFTFGQSIYQGSIDWEKGVVVGTWGMVDLGSLSWRKNANVAVFDATISDIYNRQREEENRAICSAYSGENVWFASSLQNGRFMIRGDIQGFYIRDDAYSTVSDFKTAMNGVYLAYELDTPIEIPLGGINLLTQEGQNNIFADCGDTEVKFLKVT